MSVKFCKQCNNMLYPKDNRRERELYFQCRKCRRTELVEDRKYCVYKNVIKREINMKILESVLNLKAYTEDPSLPKTRMRPCPNCDDREAVFFMNPIQMKDDDIQLYFTCLGCKHSWVDDVREKKEAAKEVKE